ncbi:hypothetical protein QYF61_010941, partial [Mycteria americana]
MVEATTRWWETYPVPHATAWNTILGLEKQVLWQHGTPERTESDNGTHFRNNLIDTWAKEHGIEWEEISLFNISQKFPESEVLESYGESNQQPLSSTPRSIALTLYCPAVSSNCTGGCCPRDYRHCGGRQKVLGPPAHVPVSDAAQADVQQCSLHSANVDTLLSANKIRHNLEPSGHKKLGGGTARTVDPNWPKGYSIPYGVMPSIETGGVGRGVAIAARGLAGHRLAG